MKPLLLFLVTCAGLLGQLKRDTPIVTQLCFVEHNAVTIDGYELGQLEYRRCNPREKKAEAKLLRQHFILLNKLSPAELRIVLDTPDTWRKFSK